MFGFHISAATSAAMKSYDSRVRGRRPAAPSQLPMSGAGAGKLRPSQRRHSWRAAPRSSDRSPESQSVFRALFLRLVRPKKGEFEGRMSELSGKREDEGLKSPKNLPNELHSEIQQRSLDLESTRSAC